MLQRFLQSELPAVCYVSVVRPAAWTRSPECTSAWQSDGWVFGLTFHQESHQDRARESGEFAESHIQVYKNTLTLRVTDVLFRLEHQKQQPDLSLLTVVEGYQPSTQCEQWPSGDNMDIRSGTFMTNRVTMYNGTSFHLVPFPLCLFSLHPERFGHNHSQWGRD